MMDFVSTFQHGLMPVCFALLAVCLFALAVLRVLPGVTDVMRRYLGMDNFGRAVCALCIVCAVLHGGGKGVSVRWNAGLADNGTLVTNDTVSVRWTYSGIPAASSVFIDYRPAGTTNEWENLAETLASALSWTGTLAAATNYDYWVYSTYVPPVPVHTNGIWVGQVYETKARVGAKSFLLLNGKIIEHGRTIAPPKWAEPPPYDAEVEYLQFTGSQYVDTEFKANTTTTKFECLISPDNVSETRGVFGSRNDADKANSASCNIFIIQNKFRLDWVDGYYSGSAMQSSSLTVGGQYQISMTRGLCMINGQQYTSANTASVAQRYNFLIGTFANGQNGVHASRFKGKFMWAKLYSNGVLVRDYIPVRKGDVGYMYDKVGGRLFGNAGTGAFGVGSDK